MCFNRVPNRVIIPTQTFYQRPPVPTRVPYGLTLNVVRLIAGIVGIVVAVLAACFFTGN